MLKTVFDKLHEHCHTGKKLLCYIYNCLECQRHKHSNVEIQTALTQRFSKYAPFLIRESLGAQKPPITLLHETNLTFLSLVTLLLQSQINA